MAVIDHAVHPSTRIGDDFRYGCWNRPRPVLGSMVKGSAAYGSQQWPFVNTPECRHDISLSDQHCRGCKHAGTGEEYVLHVRMKAAMK